MVLLNLQCGELMKNRNRAHLGTRARRTPLSSRAFHVGVAAVSLAGSPRQLGRSGES